MSFVLQFPSGEIKFSCLYSSIKRIEGQTKLEDHVSSLSAFFCPSTEAQSVVIFKTESSCFPRVVISNSYMYCMHFSILSGALNNYIRSRRLFPFVLFLLKLEHR